MDTIGYNFAITNFVFLNSKNSKTSGPHRLQLNLSDKIDSNTSDKYIDFIKSQYIKKSYKNNEFKISEPMQNGKFDLPNGSYSVLDAQDYFEYIIRKHETGTDNPLMKIYVNKIENRITFKIEASYCLKCLRRGNYLETLKVR